MFFRVSHTSRIDHSLRISEARERRRMNSFLFSSTELAKYFDAAIPISLPATPPTYVQSHSVRNSEGGELRGSCYEIFVGGRREVKRCQVKLICLPQILVLVDSAPAQDPVEVMVVPAIGLAPVQIGLIVLSTPVGRRPQFTLPLGYRNYCTPQAQSISP